MKKKLHVATVASAVGALTLVLVGVGTTVSSAGGTPALMRGSAGLTLISQRSISHGVVLTTWRDGNATVAFAGPVRSSVHAGSQGGSGAPGYAWASIDPSGSASGGSTGSSLGSSSGSYLSLTPKQAAQLMFEEAVAVGTPVAAAREMAFGPAGPTASPSKSRTSAATPDISNGTIFNSTCDHVTGDAGDAWGTSCLYQTMAQYNEPNGVYVLDKITTSGNDNDWWCNLSGLQGSDYYRYTGSYGSHGIVSWKPAASYPEGNPTTVTFSLSYNGFGVSASQTVYPAKVDPYLADYNGSYPTAFGSKWSGSQGGTTVVGMPAVDLTHIWNSGSIDAGDFVEIWWC